MREPVYFREAAVTPREVLAGDSVEITVRLVLGPDFVVPGSRIVFDMPAYLGYTRPSCYDQEDHGYMAVFCSNPDLRYLERTWNMETEDFAASAKTSFKGMAQRIFVIDFLEGNGGAGDELEVVWGFTRNGFGVGTKVCTVVLAREFYNTIHVRYFRDGARALPDLGRSFKGYTRPVPDAEIPLSFRILPREPARLRLIRSVRQAKLQVLDRFANICPVESLAPFINERPSAVRNEYGVFEIADPGVAIASKGLSLYDTPGTAGVFEGLNIYFGDLHTHSAFSNDCIEREKMEVPPDRMYEFAEKAAGLDFLAVTDHHQPWDIERNKIGRENFEYTVKAAAAATKDGRFIAFPGFEFRCARGDTVIVLGEAVPYEVVDDPRLKDIRNLWERLRGCNYLSIPHFHNPGSLAEGKWYACPYEGVEPNLEIYSCHGSYESDRVLERHIPEVKSFRPDRHGRYLLTGGHRYGLICNSDGHKGNPGFNGLTAVYARELTREAILDALRHRRVYGTTNARIRLLFTINGRLMGSILPNTALKTIRIAVRGERPLKAVDLIRNGELYQRFKPKTLEFATDLNISDAEPAYWYTRATQIDNHIAYASPIWCE
ncbi:MAG: DUF3604 domain-containing protein [Bacteroidota bacterium]